MASILSVTDEYRARMLRADRQVARELEAAYESMLQRLHADIDALVALIAAREADGRPVTRGALLRMERYRALEAQLASEMERLSLMAEGRIAGGQAVAVRLGEEAAMSSALAGLGAAGVGAVWNRLPASAVQEMVGALGDGSPLAELLGELPEQTAKDVRAALLRGVGLGWSPRKTAAQVRGAVGLSRDRALTIARTEQLRAYRNTSILSYRRNSDVVEGWVWTAARSRRTCPACLALDGRVFSLEEFFPAHPNCRCAPRPKLIGREVTGQTGEKWLEAQDEETQRRVLGIGGQKLYAAGEPLNSWLKFRESEHWGRSVGVRPLREIRRAA